MAYEWRRDDTLHRSCPSSIVQEPGEAVAPSNEELQSTNEELNTVNDELYGRNEELTRVNADQPARQRADRRNYVMRVRPFKSADNRIDGAIIALLDLEAAKK